VLTRTFSLVVINKKYDFVLVSEIIKVSKMKFNSKPVVEHKEVPLADEGKFEEVIDQWQSKIQHVSNTSETQNLSYVVSVTDKNSTENKAAKLAEILGLVKAQGDHITGQESVVYSQINPKTFIGLGLLENIAKKAIEAKSNLIVLDIQLSPSQMRNIEQAIDFPVSDRESVILNVFVKHASSRKSHIQVEIAQLKYLRPRIRGIGLNMDQQSGGIMGGRGAGETASELLARQLDKRLVQLQKAATKLTKSNANQRRQRSNCKRISLVGYTNAGKTSLMNALTNSDLSVNDQVFETLDTTTRCLVRGNNGETIISDTVGFIRNLPKQLFDSFESTLEDISETDLIVIVIDASDEEIALQIATTVEVLEKLKAHEIARHYVFNKADLLENSTSKVDLSRLTQGHEYSMLSSQDVHLVEDLKQTLLTKINGKYITNNIFVPYGKQYFIKAIYENCEVLKTSSDEQGLTYLVRGLEHILNRLIIESEEL